MTKANRDTYEWLTARNRVKAHCKARIKLVKLDGLTFEQQFDRMRDVCSSAIGIHHVCSHQFGQWAKDNVKAITMWHRRENKKLALEYREKEKQAREAASKPRQVAR